MNIYLISQATNNDYDTYDSAVVAAESEDAARHTHPRGDLHWEHNAWRYDNNNKEVYTWTAPSNVSVTLIGTADPSIEAGVICASFNAG